VIGTPTLYKDSKGQTCVSLPLISHTVFIRLGFY